MSSGKDVEIRVKEVAKDEEATRKKSEEVVSGSKIMMLGADMSVHDSLRVVFHYGQVTHPPAKGGPVPPYVAVSVSVISDKNSCLKRKASEISQEDVPKELRRPTLLAERWVGMLHWAPSRHGLSEYLKTILRFLDDSLMMVSSVSFAHGRRSIMIPNLFDSL